MGAFNILIPPWLTGGWHEVPGVKDGLVVPAVCYLPRPVQVTRSSVFPRGVGGRSEVIANTLELRQLCCHTWPRESDCGLFPWDVSATEASGELGWQWSFARRNPQTREPARTPWDKGSGPRCGHVITISSGRQRARGRVDGRQTPTHRPLIP